MACSSFAVPEAMAIEPVGSTAKGNDQPVPVKSVMARLSPAQRDGLAGDGDRALALDGDRRRGLQRQRVPAVDGDAAALARDDVDRPGLAALDGQLPGRVVGGAGQLERSLDDVDGEP